MEDVDARWESGGKGLPEGVGVGEGVGIGVGVGVGVGVGEAVGAGLAYAVGKGVSALPNASFTPKNINTAPAIPKTASRVSAI